MGLRYTDFNALPVESLDYNQQVYVAEPQFASFGSLEVKKNQDAKGGAIGRKFHHNTAYSFCSW